MWLCSSLMVFAGYLFVRWVAPTSIFSNMDAVICSADSIKLSTVSLGSVFSRLRTAKNSCSNSFTVPAISRTSPWQCRLRCGEFRSAVRQGWSLDLWTQPVDSE
ncbi:hypothetical protein P280DRAFT_96129 [Massarina eburnea CBS 473.64]|uniref:Secreted protein n=1 Tax=Massarina eburnea CBS 473.64 TaxID=1395130 RepID=A0A6A6RQQ4_9PLEO|nr:hypothetical protein P280DRAFT_96129 [Massarina eburnea CBS 473.64]